MACLAASRFSEFDMSSAQDTARDTASDTAPDITASGTETIEPALSVPFIASMVTLGLLIVVPLFLKNFYVFQLTIIVVYAIAILSLNILTGASGQFSL